MRTGPPLHATCQALCMNFSLRLSIQVNSPINWAKTPAIAWLAFEKNFPLCMRESLLVQGRSLASPNIVVWCQWECDIRHFVKTRLAWRFSQLHQSRKRKKKFSLTTATTADTRNTHTHQFNSPDYLRISYGNNVHLRPVSSSWAMHAA